MVDVYVVIKQVCSVVENRWYDTFENIFLREEDALRYALDKSNRCDSNEIKYNVEHITLE
jgi:hypothetical protein